MEIDDLPGIIVLPLAIVVGAVWLIGYVFAHIVSLFLWGNLKHRFEDFLDGDY